MDNTVIDTHESYVLVGFNRINYSDDLTLFGSAIKHHSIIQLTITRAQKERDLSSDRYYPKDQLIEIYLSPNQFAEAITLLNHGDGVPATLRWFNGKSVKPPPETNKRQEINKEFEKYIKMSFDTIEQLKKEAINILNKQQTKKADREKLKDLIGDITTHIENNLPYYADRFHETLDKTTTEAKQEIESFMNTKITNLGIKSLKEFPQLDK